MMRALRHPYIELMFFKRAKTGRPRTSRKNTPPPAYLPTTQMTSPRSFAPMGRDARR